MSSDRDKSEEATNARIWSWWSDIERFGFLRSQAEDQCDLREGCRVGSLEVVDPFCEVNTRGCPKGDRDVELNGGEYVLSGRWRRGRRVGKGGLSGPGLEEAGGIQFITGNYSDGWLQGQGKAFLGGDEEVLILEGHFQRGRLVGPVRGVDAGGRLVMVGNFSEGRAVGNFWRRLEGDGFLYGTVDDRGKFAGNDDIAYLFSDLETALRGHFADNRLVEGRECAVVACSVVDNVMELSFSEPTGPSFRYWPSTLAEIPCPPLQDDPYERKWVEVGKSGIAGAGDGLFARRAVPAGATVAFYNGIRVRPGEEPPFRSINYEIYVDWTMVSGTKSDYMDLPEEYYTSADRYRASLGHKINHSFDPNCKWDTVLHPAFGRIPRIVSLRELDPGEELTCHYMIDMQEAGANEHLSWYVEQWQQSSSKDV